MQLLSHSKSSPTRLDPLPKRTRFIGGLSRLIGAGQALGMLSDAPLSKAVFMEEAARETGLNDFGDPWFEEPLDALLEALQSEADLNTAGYFTVRQTVRKLLKDRLWAQHWFARHPEILSRPLPKPVVIVGPMRSGTTRLHRLLAVDKRFTHMRAFETLSPVPGEGFEDVLAGKRADTRPTISRRMMQIARLANPKTLSIHPTGPFEPEEELGLLVNSFWGMKLEAQWQVPSFARWSEGQDAQPAYDQLARLLKLVGWTQQASSIRPWILKTPQHMLHLPQLMKAFPDARIIVTHRGPRSIVGSAASLAWNQSIIYSDNVSPRSIGEEWLRKSALQIERMQASRSMVAPDRIVDVHYDDMERDWRGTMERLYAFLGFDIAPAWEGMEAYMTRSEALKRRPHRYAIEQFGLSGEEVDARFAEYVAAQNGAASQSRAPAKPSLRAAGG